MQNFLKSTVTAQSNQHGFIQAKMNMKYVHTYTCTKPCNGVMLVSGKMSAYDDQMYIVITTDRLTDIHIEKDTHQ